MYVCMYVHMHTHTCMHTILQVCIYLCFQHMYTWYIHVLSIYVYICFQYMYARFFNICTHVYMYARFFNTCTHVFSYVYVIHTCRGALLLYEPTQAQKSPIFPQKSPMFPHISAYVHMYWNYLWRSALLLCMYHVYIYIYICMKKDIHVEEEYTSTYIHGEVGGWGRDPFSRNFMKPTPRRKWYLTTGRRFH